MIHQFYGFLFISLGISIGYFGNYVKEKHKIDNKHYQHAKITFWDLPPVRA
jgi:hypothetical protein